MQGVRQGDGLVPCVHLSSLGSPGSYVLSHPVQPWPGGRVDIRQWARWHNGSSPERTLRGKREGCLEE